jgi:hypothetical protein
MVREAPPLGGTNWIWLPVIETTKPGAMSMTASASAAWSSAIAWRNVPGPESLPLVTSNEIDAEAGVEMATNASVESAAAARSPTALDHTALPTRTPRSPRWRVKLAPEHRDEGHHLAGMTADVARGQELRSPPGFLARDGETFLLRADVQFSRINLELEDGVVTQAVASSS